MSKNVYIDKLDEAVNKYKDTYHRAIKKITRKTLNLKLMVMLEYQNTKMYLQKAMFQILLKNFL